MVMGCYGIGVSRIMAAAVEQHHDERGIVWPVSIAPFLVAVIPLGKPGDATADKATEIYAGLRGRGLAVLLDDRPERAGVKFKDAELQGHPFQIVVGQRGLDEGMAELKDRRTGTSDKVPFDRVVDEAHQRVLAAASSSAPASAAASAAAT